MRTRRATLARIAAVVCLIAAGCAQPKTTVTGKVTYRGKPVPWGAITLISADGISYAGALQADGSFAIPGVPVGGVKITVRSENPSAGRTTPAPPRGKAVIPTPVPKPVSLDWFPIPDRYADPDRSGLTADVQTGKSLVIDLQ